MKIALYLQNIIETASLKKKFYEKMAQIKAANVDLLVFPENVYTPFVEEMRKLSILEYGEASQLNQLEEYVKHIAELCGCPIIFCDIDREGTIYSIFYNPYAGKKETDSKEYYKHVATYNSVFNVSDYSEAVEEIFAPIQLKGLSIGHLICHDSNFSLFSRMYGLNKVDVIINSSGGHVDHKKWSYYQKVRALENHCYTLCVMAHHDESAKNHSCIIGYDPYGRNVEFTLLGTGKTNNMQVKDGIYITEINARREKVSENNYLHYSVDEYLDQTATSNKNVDFTLDLKELLKKLPSMDKIVDNLYRIPRGNENIIVAYLHENYILQPECVESLLYHKELRGIQNKRYIILNDWGDLSLEYYRRVLSNILKVRAAENYCAVALHSNIVEMCYQVGRNKNIQVLKEEEGNFGLDLSRTTGPEALWKTKQIPAIHASWREGYEWLLEYVGSK